MTDSTQLTSHSYFGKVWVGLTSLFSGMRLTLGYLFSPSRVVTQQYPENRLDLTMLPRFRGMVAMPHDTEGEHRCTACGICEKACPNGTISILSTKNIAGKKVLGQFVYRLGQCTLCNLCVESCPFGAIVMAQDYELATTAKDSLVLILNRKEGRG